MSMFDLSFRKTNNTPGCLGCGRESSPPFSTSRYASAPRDHPQLLLSGADQQQKEKIDTLLADAFNTLSFEERQAQQEELHGVADEIAEDATLIEKSLQELEFYLNHSKTGRVYETAERQGPAYVYARSFRISFLRADRYNAKAAADRMLRFFDEKQKLFGIEKLTKDITIDDLDQDDIAALKTGQMQWAGRDRSNRPILLHLASARTARTLKDLENELRTRYFLMMEAAKCTEIQQRGFVVLSYMVGDYKDSHQGYGFAQHSNLAESIPLFTGAFHLACDDIKQHLFHTAMFALMPADLRARFRLHFGSHVECQYRLSTYGIPTALLPLSPMTHALDLTPHLRWCQQYISSDHDVSKNQLTTASFPSSYVGAVVEPNPNDVLSAGSKKSDNVGNDRLRVLVKKYVEVYRSGSSDERRRIVDRIIDEIHEEGGRFLHQNKAMKTWCELPTSKVRLKITQRFRNHNRRRESASDQARKGTLISDMPMADDVIFGGRTQRNKGTMLLHELIKDRWEEYVSANRSAKAAVVEAVIRKINSEGGRFLQPSESDLGRYVELSYDSIRDRISTYFRNYRRPSRIAKMPIAL